MTTRESKKLETEKILSIEAVEELVNEIKKTRSALVHLYYRTHPHSPSACSPCEWIDEIVNQQVPTKPEPKS